MKNRLFAALLAALWLGCTPQRDDEFQLPPTPGAPQFSVAFVEGDSNRVVVRDLTQGAFQRVWSLPGGTPATSVKAVDTITYSKAGTYTITLFASMADGSGTPSASQTVVIANDGALTCSPKLELLTGCGDQGKCWTLSRAAGAVRVGPTYDDYSWFTSTENGLQDAQYDDGFCFTFDGLLYENRNNGFSVDPWNGYAVVAYNPGVSSFVFQEGTGTNNRDQILIPDDQFMGVWDADNLMDIVVLSEDELVVRTRIRAQNGTPNAEGWFELRFVPQ